MAATFVFKLGALDLSSYLRVHPEDNMDPYGKPWLEPDFSETTFADEQPLIFQTVTNRQQEWPLFLSDPSYLKDQLHALIRKIQIAGAERPLTVTWQDDGATHPTFFDVMFVRFEPNFNFRRSQHGYGCGVLRVWAGGYAHTGTLRNIGTAAGTGVFISVPVASLGGDERALLQTVVHAGAIVPSLGRIVAVAPIHHPSYTPLIPAASLTEPQTNATLIGASGAQGSQYLALPVSPTGGASGVACRVPLPNPTIAGGDNRILAVVKSGIAGGIGIRCYDPYGNALGATSVASMSAGWGVVDLGVCRLPTVGYPTQPELTLEAGAVSASGGVGPAIYASPAGLALNEIIVLPDKHAAIVLENHAAASAMSSEEFNTGNVRLLGSSDAQGHTWQAPQNNAAAGAFGTAANSYERSLYGLVGGGAAAASPMPSCIDGDSISGVLSESCRIGAIAVFPAIASLARYNIYAGPTIGLQELRLFKDVAPSQFVQLRLSGSQFLALEAATGGAVGNTLASKAFTVSAGSEYVLSLSLEGRRAWANAQLVTGAEAQASVGVASNAAVSGLGAPAFAHTIPSLAAGLVQGEWGPYLQTWSVTTLPSSTLAPYDAYTVDGTVPDTYRTASSGVFGGQKLVGVQRGTWPRAAPSTSSVAIVCAPFDQGAANDVMSVSVSAKERYFYAR